MSTHLLCDVCNTEHKSVQALWKHKQLHLGTQIKCSKSKTCGYSSVYVADVRVHELRCGKSADVKDWVCDCGCSYTVKQNWQKHSRKNPGHQLIRKNSIRMQAIFIVSSIKQVSLKVNQSLVQPIVNQSFQDIKSLLNVQMPQTSPLPHQNAQKRIAKSQPIKKD